MDVYFIDWDKMWMKSLEMSMTPPELPAFRPSMFADFGMPAVLDSRRVVVMDDVSFWDGIRQLIHEIELRLCNDAIDEMYRDVGGEG